MASKGKHILVVDDEPHITDMFARILEDDGYEVSVANDGEECLRKLEELDVDLVVLDFFMPGMSGRKVSERIRADPRYRDVKIVFATAAEFGSEGRKTMESLGIADYIEKPIEAKDFKRRIADAVAGRSAESVSGQIRENQAVLMYVPNNDYTDHLMGAVKDFARDFSHILYVSINKNYPLLKKTFDRYGIDDSKFHVIDAMTVSVNPNPPKIERGSYISSPAALTELEQEMARVVDAMPVDLIIFDSPSALLIYHEDPHPVLQLIHRLICRISILEAKVVFPAIENDPNNALAEDLKMLTDKIVSL